ncbi:MAG TPA: hypothetical protein DCE42_17435 [Myxococcales bacterium]|nr:hypothetical protein [Deltaproteobacteria bacterium]MBU52290.1 hypothetical protein [Deltaproteobacteria bacterium]HAA56553.1 hypothetical protein [Myxococcales bacterium]
MQHNILHQTARLLCLFACLGLLIVPQVSANPSGPTSYAPQHEQDNILEGRRRRCRSRFCRKARRAFRSSLRCLRRALKNSGYLEAEGSITIKRVKGTRRLVAKVVSIFPEKHDLALKKCVHKRVRRYKMRRAKHNLSMTFPYHLRRRR